MPKRAFDQGTSVGEWLLPMSPSEAPPALPKLVSRPDGARALGVSQNTFDRIVSDGRLSTVRIGRRVFVREDDLASFIENASAR